jgi:hypothetical protein
MPEFGPLPGNRAEQPAVQIVVAAGNTLGTTLSRPRHALSLSFTGNISGGFSNSQLELSVPAQGLSAGGASGTAGTFVFSNSNNVSFGYNAGTVTATATVATSLTNVNLSAGTTSGNLSAVTFSNANGVSFGLNASTITGSVAGQTNQSGLLYVSSNTFLVSTSGSYDARSISLAGSGNCSVAIQSAAGGWIVSVPAQTNQSVGLYGLGNTTQNSSTTLDARSLSFNGLGEISVGFSNGSIQLSAPVTVAQTAQTLGLYAVSNTTQNSSTTLDARTLSFDGLGAMSVGFSNGSVQLSAPVQTNQSGNVYASSNTTGTSSGTYDARTVSIAGAGAISVAASNSGFVVSSPVTSSLSATGWVQISSNGSTISIGATTTANLYAVGNTFGTSSGTADIRTLSFSAGSGVQVAASNSGYVVGMQVLSYFSNVDAVQGTTTMSVQGSTSYIQPFFLPSPLSISYIRMPVTMSTASTSNAAASGNVSASMMSTLNAVIYSLGVGGNSNSLRSVASGSAGFSQQWSLSITGAAGTDYSYTQQITYPLTGGTSSFSTSSAVTSAAVSVSNASNFAGLAYLDIPFATSLAPGAYWLGFGISSANTTAGSSFLGNAVISFSNWAVTQPNVAIAPMGAATNSSVQLALGLGSFTTNAIGTTASLDLSNISSSASQPIIPFQMIRQV